MLTPPVVLWKPVCYASDPGAVQTCSVGKIKAFKLYLFINLFIFIFFNLIWRHRGIVVYSIDSQQKGRELDLQLQQAVLC